MNDLSLEWAQAILAYGSEKVRTDLNKTACLSVCDRHGFLVAFVRMDTAPVRSIQLAQQKAYTCTRMGSSTEAFLARLRRDDIPIGYFCDALLTALPGGALLGDARGNAMGGIGVSGLTPAEDQAIADDMARFGAQCRASGDE
jgi:uncharacterized protein GlcG (DUF336 family)